MLENIIGRVPTGMILACTIASGLVPFMVYKINKALHKHGDPPWKNK